MASDQSRLASYDSVDYRSGGALNLTYTVCIHMTSIRTSGARRLGRAESRTTRYTNVGGPPALVRHWQPKDLDGPWKVIDAVDLFTRWSTKLAVERQRGE